MYYLASLYHSLKFSSFKKQFKKPKNLVAILTDMLLLVTTWKHLPISVKLVHGWWFRSAPVH